MAEEQEVTIDIMDGVGPAVLEVFRHAGYTTILHLKAFDAEDRKLQKAIDTIKGRADKAGFPPSYWKALATRCVNIIYRAKSAEATPFVPHEYMCPITLDWYDDPVVTPSGHSYSREAIVEWISRVQRDPVTRTSLSESQLYPNLQLRAVVDHYRRHHQRFSILDLTGVA